MNTQPQSVMAEDKPDDADQDEQQTIEIPLAALGMVPKEGEPITLKVISIDQQNGVVNAVAMKPKSSGGSDAMAAELQPMDNKK